MTMNANFRYGVGILLAVILFLTLNVFATGSFTGAKMDLTGDKLFTLSDGTRRVLAEVDEPIVLRLYLSRQLLSAQPGLANFAQRVQEILAQYVDLSGGAIRLEVFDPEPFSEIEDRAVGFGLSGLPVGPTQESAYFGLAASNSTDDEEIIPFFDPAREAFLEYDLTKLVYSLAHPEKIKIGVVTSLAMQGDFRRRADPWVIADQMKQFYDVTFLGQDFDAVPDDISVLMVVHPKGLSRMAQYAIDRHVRNGGASLLFMDPHSETDAAAAARAQPGQPPADTASDLRFLLDAWGLTVNTEDIVGDAGSARRVQTRDGNRPVVTDYVSWLALEEPRFMANHPALMSSFRIHMASAGAISLPEDSGLSLEPLITSSPDSMLIPGDELRLNPDPLTLIRNFDSEGTERVLAARISGVLGEAFPDGPPEGVDPIEVTAGAALNLTVFADTDMLSDPFWVRVQDFFGEKLTTPFAHNGDFVLNMLDHVSGGAQISDLRGRGLSVRRFEVIEALQAQAEIKFRSEEQHLLDTITETEQKLTDMRAGTGGTQAPGAEETAALDALQADLLASRGQLRHVQRALLSEIDALEQTVRLTNIFAMPAAVIVFAVVFLSYRRRRARRRVDAVAAS